MAGSFREVGSVPRASLVGGALPASQNAVACHADHGAPAYPADMADGSDTTLTTEPSASAESLAASIKSFASGHGGAKAVIEYVGRKGARIVLVGEDGTWSDQFAEGTDIARQACENAGVAVQNEWEREL